jgi:hypothetical protein
MCQDMDVEPQFNKKRYISSRHDLPKKTYYILNAKNINDALVEASEILSIDIGVLRTPKIGAYIFDGVNGSQGFWFGYSDRMDTGVPF